MVDHPFEHGASGAPCDHAVFDGDHTVESGENVCQQFFVEGFAESQVEMGGVDPFRCQPFARLYDVLPNGSVRNEGKVGTVSDPSTLTDSDFLEGGRKVHSGCFTSGVTDGKRTLIVEGCGIHEVPQVQLVERGGENHIGNAPHVRDVKRAVVGRTVGAGKTCTIEAKNDREAL